MRLGLLARQDVAAELTGDEAMVFDPVTRSLHRLNSITSFVLWHCDGTRTSHDLAALLQQETGTPEGPELVEQALQRLCSAGLLLAPVPLA
jgi:hypothetical protein